MNHIATRTIACEALQSSKKSKQYPSLMRVRTHDPASSKKGLMNLNQFLTLVENLVVLSPITDSFGQVTASTYLRCAELVRASSFV
jgi:hypothetical protein